MNSFEQTQRELERQGRGDALRRLADSEDGKRIGRMVDAEKIKRAAQNGDSRALQDILRTVLSTDEGRRLAENVKKMLEK